jgi:hypothetical protein
MIRLRCGCMVNDDGKFEVGDHCRNCVECNAVAQIHPFGTRRLAEVVG